MDIVSRLEEIPLSGNDLEHMSRAMGREARAVNYSDLRDESLESLFSGSDVVFVLYQILNKDGHSPGQGGKPVVGHWICLLSTPTGIMYFDPYGLSISEDLHVTGEPDYFSSLLSGQKVDVNPFRHQAFRDEINTCGRHCVSRGLFPCTNKQYAEYIESIKKARDVKNADVYVSILTAFLDPEDRALLLLCPSSF